VTAVSTLYLRHPHHSAFSGYPRFVERLDRFVETRRVRPLRLPSAPLQRHTERIVYEWFDADRLRIDLTAASRLVTGRNEVVHLLYGETDHFYAGRLRRLGRLRGNRLVATFHQPPALLDELLPAPPLFEQLDHAIALGPRAATHLAQVVPAPVSCAFHGVDTEAWHPRPSARAATPTCAFVGSWFRDFDVLADVIRTVSAAEPAVRFEVVTAPSRVEALAKLPGVRAHAGISDSELRDVYQRSWVHLLPLTDAVANNALQEAMACGIATVATDVGDVAHYAGDGARLVPGGDAEAMANVVLDLLSDDRARELLGGRARVVAESRSLTAAALRHARIYADVLRA
jgi:glycosyltransferase involved in cell wall biosynthesis